MTGDDSTSYRFIMNAIKYAVNENERFKRLIPLLSLLLGMGLGGICFYFIPNIIAAENVVTAIGIGASCGMSATGINQMIKQIGKSNGCAEV